MFSKSKMVNEGSSVKKAMNSPDIADFPVACQEIYAFYKMCLRERVYG